MGEVLVLLHVHVHLYLSWTLFVVDGQWRREERESAGVAVSYLGMREGGMCVQLGA